MQSLFLVACPLLKPIPPFNCLLKTARKYKITFYMARQIGQQSLSVYILIMLFLLKPQLPLYFFYFIDNNIGYFNDILTAQLEMSLGFISEVCISQWFESRVLCGFDLRENWQAARKCHSVVEETCLWLFISFILPLSWMQHRKPFHTGVCRRCKQVDPSCCLIVFRLMQTNSLEAACFGVAMHGRKTNSTALN